MKTQFFAGQFVHVDFLKNGNSLVLDKMMVHKIDGNIAICFAEFRGNKISLTVDIALLIPDLPAYVWN